MHYSLDSQADFWVLAVLVGIFQEWYRHCPVPLSGRSGFPAEKAGEYLRNIRYLRKRRGNPRHDTGICDESDHRENECRRQRNSGLVCDRTAILQKSNEDERRAGKM